MRKKTLSPTIRQEIRTIVSHYIDPGKYSIVLFGSHATGNAKKQSDIDVALQGEKPLALSTIACIKEALEESNIPVRVDVVDLAHAPPSFRATVQKHAVPL